MATQLALLGSRIVWYMPTSHGIACTSFLRLLCQADEEAVNWDWKRMEVFIKSNCDFGTAYLLIYYLIYCQYNRGAQY